MDELTQVTLALGLAALCRPTEPHVRETAADVRSQPSPPLSLLQLPDECLALVLQHAGASDDARELLAATGLLGDGDAVPRPRDAEAILADYLTDHLARGAVRALDVDSMDEPGMISV